MYILADLSGIQDFLFQVQVEGGGQAASLRSRSFRIQLIAEVLSQQLLRELQPSKLELLFCSAGKVLLRCSPSEPQVHTQLGVLQTQMNHWLLEKTHGLLRLSLAVSDATGSEQQQYQQAMDRLAARKLQAWQPVKQQPWSPDMLVTATPMDWQQQAKADEPLGHRLRNQAQWWAAYDPVAAPEYTQDILNLKVAFYDHDPAITPAPVFKDRLNTLLRHIPRDEGDRAVEFVDLAAEAQGAPMLAVLKADADSLGLTMKQLLETQGITGMKTLSARLETFFGSELDQLMRSDTTKSWSRLYTIFSGGDDLLLIGPWNIVLDFADELHRQFHNQFGKHDPKTGCPPLTFSAGIVLFKPKFPIRLAAQQAEDLLHQAKNEKSPNASAAKDQCACLGGLWKWSDHSRILQQAKQLTQWVDDGVLQRGWLQTLLQLTLLRRGEIPDTPRHEQLMATARLAYHISRNWPRINSTPSDDKDRAASAARLWIDKINREFDRYQTTDDVTTLHLPVILRYAMLATRTANDKE